MEHWRIQRESQWGHIDVFAITVLTCKFTTTKHTIKKNNLAISISDLKIKNNIILSQLQSKINQEGLFNTKPEHTQYNYAENTKRLIVHQIPIKF